MYLTRETKVAKRMETLALDHLRETLDYDPATGIFVWKAARRGVRAGAQAGSTDPNGYRYIRLDQKDYLAQRLAWFWVNGVWPTIVRFKDSNTNNCAIDNLYEGFSLSAKHNYRTPEGRAAYQLEYRAQRRPIAREKELMRSFGLDNEAYQKMFAAQAGVCSICEKPEKRRAKNGQVRWLAVDHDHATGANRDLLCSDCNQMIGFACDSPEILIKAIAYLRRHKKTEPVVNLSLVDNGAA